MSDPIDVGTADELRGLVRGIPEVRVAGGGTKTALSRSATVRVAGLRGIVEYEPSEYTITALAGTPVRDIAAVLAEHGQFLPFDPPLVDAGSTLGGTIASGLSGSGRFRYGGIRDFLLGVRLVNGDGDIVRGGGRVVKNAAGFDIPRLTVGSLGCFGALIEATFKVFPRPESYATLIARSASMDEAIENLQRIAHSAEEPACLDLVDRSTLHIRIGGMASALSHRVERVRRLLRGTVDVVVSDDGLWSESREFAWVPPGHHLAKVPITTSQIGALESEWESVGAGPRRYAAGGHVLWLAWPGGRPWDAVDRVLRSFGRSALVVFGDGKTVQHGVWNPTPFAQRLARVFDPNGVFRLAPARTGPTDHP